jgi:hypothetical protein
MDPIMRRRLQGFLGQDRQLSACVLYFVTVVGAIDDLCDVARCNAWNRVCALDLFFDVVALRGSENNFVSTLTYRIATHQDREQLGT